MSLEARIAELNDNIKALISVMQQQSGAVITEVKAEPVKKSTTRAQSAAVADSSTTEAPESTAGTAKVAEPNTEQTGATVVTADSAETPVELKADEVTLAEVTQVVLALGKAGKRDALVKLLGEYGVPKASALDPSKFAEFHTKANALLGG